MEETAGNYIRSGVIYINNPAECFICKRTGLDAAEKYCPGCGFPQNGDQTEQKAFYLDHFEKSAVFQDAQKQIKGAQNILFVAAGFMVLGALILGALTGSAEDLVANLVLAGIFVGLGFWAKSKPLAASVTGLVIYATVVILTIVVWAMSGGSGRPPIGIMTIVVIITLVKGISGALKAEKIKKEKGWE